MLKKTEGNQVLRAANLLGINRNTLRTKIKEPEIKGASPAAPIKRNSTVNSDESQQGSRPAEVRAIFRGEDQKYYK